MTQWARCFLLLLLIIPASASASDNPLSFGHRGDVLNEFIRNLEGLFPSKNPPSTWADAKSWKPIGDRFAAAYDRDGKLIAIYDLSYPEMRNPIELAEIGSARVAPENLVELWRSAKLRNSELPRAEASAIDALGEAPESLLRNGIPSEEDWRSLPWKTKAERAPSSFRITDLDPARIRLSPRFFTGLRQLFSLVLDDSAAIQSLSDDELIGSFRFVRSAEGGYRILWSDPRRSADISRPRKLLDFRSPESSLDRNIEFDSAIFALGEATSLIPVPVAQALISTAVSRLGRYADMTRVEHLEMLREVAIETGENSNVDSELENLSAADLETLRESFDWSRVSPIEFWNWLFSHPDDAWNKDAERIAKCEDTSARWFTDHQEAVEVLNPRFSIGTNSRLQKVLYLDGICKNSAPSASIDYSNPQATAITRQFVEAEGASLEFATNLLPTVGFAIREAYTLLFQNSIDDIQYWEARLTQHLELRPENWQNELAILEAQRTNPMEISREKMKALVAKRRASLGL